MTDTKTLPDIPAEKIQEVAAAHSAVIVKLRRTTPRGQWASVCAPLQKATLDLIQPEGWLEKLAGGGAYQLQAFSCMNPSEQVVPSFMVNIEGLPRQASLANAAAEWQAPGIPGRPREPLFQGGHEMRDYQRNENPQNWERPPDAVASERARDERHERISRDRQWSQERDQMQEKMEGLQRQLTDQKERHQQEILAARERALEAKIEAALSGNRKSPAFDGTSLAAIVAAAAPVLTAMITSGRDRAALSSDSTAKMHEMHLQGINTMLEATAKQPKFDLEKLIATVVAAVPTFAPLVKTFLDDRSPTKTAEVITSMSQSSLEMLGMVTQILQQQAPDSDNPWHQVAQNAIKSVGDVLERMAAGSQPQPQQLQENTPQQQPQQQQPATSPEAIAKAICAAPQVHPTLRTQDWEQVYVRLHRGDPAHLVAEDIAGLLDQMAGVGTLPPFLERVFVDENPSTYLAPFLYQLPVSQNPQYVRAVLEAFDEAVAPEKPAAAPQAAVRAAPAKPQPVRAAPAARPAARRPTNGNGGKPRVVARDAARPETTEDLPELPALEADEPPNEPSDDNGEGADEELVGFNMEPAENP